MRPTDQHDCRQIVSPPDRGYRLAMKKLALLAFAFAALPSLAEATVAASYQLTPEDNAKFLADFAAEPGVVKLPGGLMYQVIEPGDGKGTSPLGRQDIVTVEYRGWLINRQIFDQTKPYEPRVLTTGNLIPG